MNGEPEFDALLREACEEEDAPAGRPRGPGWLLVTSVGALLVGVAGVVAALLIAGAATAPRPGPAPVAEAPLVAESPPPREALEPTGPAPAETGIAPDWVAGVADRTGIPPRVLTAYAEAAARMAQERPGCGLGWNTLAGIGFVESEHGTHGGGSIAANGRAVPPIVGVPLDGTSTERIPDTDDGALDGDAVWDRAVGPMQFIPSTWGNWQSDGNDDGISDPQNIDDAAYATAWYLCSMAGDLRDPEQWIVAIAAYNDTVEYNNRVADAANHYASLAAGP